MPFSAPTKAVVFSMPTWVFEVYELVKTEQTDHAIDVLFAGVDDLLSNEWFFECDQIIGKIDLEQLDTHLLVGLLSITFTAKSVLPGRPDLVRRVEERLKILAPDRIEGLMRGLA